MLRKSAQGFWQAVPRKVVGLGTAAFQDGSSLSDVVASAAKDGIRLFDTAQNYGSEVELGKGLRRSGVGRGELWINAKVDLNSEEDPVARMERQVMSSLKNLGLDVLIPEAGGYLDSVMVHWPVCLDNENGDHKAIRAESWRGLERLVEQGLVRNIGVSNWTCDLLDELLSMPDLAVKPAVNQIEYSPLVHQVDIRDYCDAMGIRVMSYSPYGMCWLALYAAEDSGVTYGVTNLLQHETVLRIAQESGATPAQVLLIWGLEQGVLQIPKSAHPGRVREAFHSLRLAPLSEDHRASLDALSVCPQRGTAASIQAHLKVIQAHRERGATVPT